MTFLDVRPESATQEWLMEDLTTNSVGSSVINYGLYVMNFCESSDLRTLVGLGIEAEGAGWNGFFLTDAGIYHNHGHETPNHTFTTLTANSNKKKHVRLRTSVAVF